MVGADVRRGLRFGTLALAAIALGGCAGPLSTLDPAGPAAHSIARIWYVMLIGGSVLFVFVMALFALAFMRRDWRWSDASGKRWVLYGGLVMPTAVLTALLVFALTTGEGLLAHGRSDEVVSVSATGERWQWRFGYPGSSLPVETLDVLHIPAGEPVDVLIRSDDVIHSFWVPRLAGKMDAIPGHTNVLRIEADREGTFGGQCSEYCGFGHARMSFEVVAHSPERFRELVASGFADWEGRP